MNIKARILLSVILLQVPQQNMATLVSHHFDDDMFISAAIALLFIKPTGRDFLNPFSAPAATRAAAGWVAI